jgi:hypothetical protein
MDDIFEFIEDYIKTIKYNEIKDFIIEFMNIIRIIPEMIKNLKNYLIILSEKIWMKIRSKIILSITNDMRIVDTEQELWDKLNTNKEDNIKILEIVINKIKDQNKKKIYIKLKNNVIKNDKNSFIKYCIEKQHNVDFIQIKKQIDQLLK